MTNKFLITLYVPSIENKYEIFIPNSKRIADIIILCTEIINSLNDNQYGNRLNRKIINRKTGKEYSSKEIVNDTDIKNGTELIML